MRIKNLKAREILDSRGNPTIEVDLELENGIKTRASVPSGASTGSREALELRDGDENRYLGKGVLKAVENVNTVIKNAVVGQECNYKDIDKLMLSMDTSEFKSELGANAILAVSLAVLKAEAIVNNKELYEFVGDNYNLPIPMMNIINGGAHADNNLEIQEFMIVPKLDKFSERLRAGAEIFHNLKSILKSKGLNTGVGDEGGFAPKLQNNEEALSLIVEAITKAGYKAGEEVFIALDCAASEFYDEDKNLYTVDGKSLSPDELINYYEVIIDKYPICSIEDPFVESDFDALSKFTEICGDKIMIVGDDYFVTNIKYLEKAINMKAGNAILLKANQIGTMSEMFETIELARDNNYNMVISHRSGETEDTFISDIAVGLNIPYIKTGSLCRGERINKYNQLLRIEEQLQK